MIALNHPKNLENDKFVRLVYLICKESGTSNRWFDDGRFQAPDEESNTIESACQRISICALLVQYFFWKTVGKTFRLELDDEKNNCPIVHRFLIDGFDHEKLRRMNQIELWRLVGNQLMNSEMGSSKCKYIAFCSFSRFSPNSGEPFWVPSKQVQGYVSLGGNDLALLSTHCLYTWPTDIQEIEARFRDDRHVNSNIFMDDSDNRNTRSGCFSTTLGAMIHELAHTFQLGHRTNGIMARKFNRINEFFFPDENLMQEDIRENNEWWTLEDLIILRSNPWLISKTAVDSDYNSKTGLKTYLSSSRNVFDIHQHNNGILLHSKYGLRLVEYRHLDSNLVLESKIFDEPTRVYKLKCSMAVDSERSQKHNCLKLFILDHRGNTKSFHLKEKTNVWKH